MKYRKEVHSGAVKFGDQDTLLRAVGIGSCVVVAIVDLETPRGGMAHVMLPGRPPASRTERLGRYARNALARLRELLETNGVNLAEVAVVLAGGANVLQEPGKEVGRQNIQSTKEILSEYSLPVVAESLGGVQRRSISFQVDTGKIHCSVGSGEPEMLWERPSDKLAD